MSTRNFFATPENGVDADGVEDIDMACAITTSTGMSTGEQLTSTEEDRGPSFPPSSTSPPGSPDISKCNVSAVTKGDDCIDGMAGGVDSGGEATGERKEGSSERDCEEDKTNGARLNCRELDTSVRVKIADLGNACWVVSPIKCLFSIRVCFIRHWIV